LNWKNKLDMFSYFFGLDVALDKVTKENLDWKNM
jgi:hypothetical protein